MTRDALRTQIETCTTQVVVTLCNKSYIDNKILFIKLDTESSSSLSLMKKKKKKISPID